MASEADMSEPSSMFERLVRNRDLSLFLPFIFGFASNLQRQREFSQESSDHRENDDNRPNDDDDDDDNNRVILINPFTQGMVVIDGVSSLDSLLRELGNKDGQPPASKESVKAMPSVEIAENGEECVICLEEFEVGGLAREMPCKHRFHDGCIEKWLGIHGSCPVCRHKMPAEEESGDGTRRGLEREREREIWVSFSFNSRVSSRNSSDDSNQTSSTDSGYSSSEAD